MTALWHIHFDNDPAVAMHICDLHKAIGDALDECDSRRPDGDCDHVQSRSCDCAAPPECDGCFVDGFQFV